MGRGESIEQAAKERTVNVKSLEKDGGSEWGASIATEAERRETEHCKPDLT